MSDFQHQPDETAPAWYSVRPSLSHPAVRGAALTFGSYALSQAMRLGSNLILTRLLVPDAFGLMLFVSIVIQGLEMFSDFGISQSIIQNRRGDEPKFLRTVWTIQILRSFVLWIGAAILSVPLAHFYNDLRLEYVLPIAALTTIIDAFSSAQASALNRRLQLVRLVAIDLFSYGVTIVIMVGGAYYVRETGLIDLELRTGAEAAVWPLLIGTLFGSLVSMILSHLVLGGPRMRFQLDREVLGEVFHFGKWLFISSILTFLGAQLDRLVLGKFMTMSDLGVYSIAFMFSQVMVQIVRNISQKVLFPVYARTAELGPELLRRQIFRSRLALLGVALPPLWVLIVLGPELIYLLYDERYAAAGWMLQILGAGAIAMVVQVTVESVFIATGDSYRHMLLQLLQSLVMLSAMLVGGLFYGAEGIIAAYAAAAYLSYPCLAMLVHRHNAWLPRLDLAAVALSAAAIAAGFSLKEWAAP